MGLDCTHGAWNGPYSMFHRWRQWLAEQIGIPLELMEGFYSSNDNLFSLLEYRYSKGDELDMWRVRELKKMLPLKWDAFKSNALHVLLYHSDCDGELTSSECGKIAKELKKILAVLPNDSLESKSPETARGIYDGNYDATVRFMKGCELAFKKKQKLKFG